MRTRFCKIKESSLLETAVQLKSSYRPKPRGAFARCCIHCGARAWRPVYDDVSNNGFMFPAWRCTTCSAMRWTPTAYVVWVMVDGYVAKADLPGADYYEVLERMLRENDEEGCVFID